MRLVLVIVIIVLDQITKLAVRASMEVGDVIPVLGDLLSIRFVQNTGVAFGMMTEHRWIVTLIQVLVIIVIAYILFKSPDLTKHSDIILSMILAGGIGNLIDRLLLGYVTDMISVGFFPPVFNVADIAVTVGCFFLLLELIMDASKAGKEGQS